MKYHPILFCMVIGILNSCTKPIFIDIPNHTPKLVVNAILEPGKDFGVFVGSTTSINSPKNTYEQLLRDATVTLDKDNGLHYSLFANDSIVTDTLGPFVDPLGDTIYYIDSTSWIGFFLEKPIEIKPGDTYRLSVEYHDFQSVSAEVTIPKPVKITHARLERNALVDFEGNLYHALNLEIDDPPSEANFYTVKLYQVLLDRKSLIPVYAEESIQNMNLDFLKGFTDQEFEKSSNIYKIYFRDFSIQGPSLLEGGGVLGIDLFSLSESYYKYEMSIADYSNISNLEVGLLGAESVHVYSNVEGGFGVFSALTQALETYTLEY